MYETLFVAACLMLVLEGMLPFLAPDRWRQFVLRLAALQDSEIRNMGLLSMVIGAVLLYFFN